MVLVRDWNPLQLIHGVPAIDHLAENSVPWIIRSFGDLEDSIALLQVQGWLWSIGDEPLTTIAVRSRVRHRHHSSSLVFQLVLDLVLKFICFIIAHCGKCVLWISTD